MIKAQTIKKTVKSAKKTSAAIPAKKISKISSVNTKERKTEKSRNFLQNVGRRKTSVARVRLFTKGDGKITVNGKDFKDYFPGQELQGLVKSPIKRVGAENFDISVKVKGGGIHSQAEAVRHGISRALLIANQGFRKRLKRAGFLKRDARMKERRKFGLKKARKAPQWSKR